MPKRAHAPSRETDLYEPIRDYLMAQGYTVRSEVHHCDVTASKGDDLIVIELKRQFGVDLLIQATARQRITDSVYVAFPKPAINGRGRHWRGVQRLIRQLELGLILVDFGNASEPKVNVVYHPLPYRRRKRSKSRRAVIQEIAARSGDYNRAGSHGAPLMTAYRENAFLIACCLDRFGPTAPRQLRALGAGAKTLSILYNNVYGWFERVDRGVYSLSAQGREEVRARPELAERVLKRIDVKTAEAEKQPF